MYETIINCIFVMKKMVYSYKNETSLKRVLFMKKMVIPVNTVHRVLSLLAIEVRSGQTAGRVPTNHSHELP